MWAVTKSTHNRYMLQCFIAAKSDCLKHSKSDEAIMIDMRIAAENAQEACLPLFGDMFSNGQNIKRNSGNIQAEQDQRSTRLARQLGNPANFS